MDILVRLRDLYINFVYNLPIGISIFILRMSVFLILSILLLILAWVYIPWRNVFFQTCIAFSSFSLVLYLPIQHLRKTGPDFFAFLVGIGFSCMIYIPNWLPFFLTPLHGNQIRLKRIIRYTIWSLFLLQIMISLRIL